MLSAAETKDAKVHVTLRLDAALYRAILPEKRSAHDATTTATVERLLHERLAAARLEERAVVEAVRSLLVHGMYQEALLGVVARLVKPRTRKEKALLERLERAFPSDPASEESVARLNGVSFLLREDLAESLRALGGAEAAGLRNSARGGGVLGGMGSNFRPLLRSLLFSIVLPLIAVQVLTHRGVSVVVALAVAAVFPLGDGAFGLARRRGFDPIGGLVLCSLVVGIALTLITRNPAFGLAQGSIVTLLFGGICLASLAAPRPLMFVLGRRYSTGDDPAAKARWDARWEIPQFRTGLRGLTILWGVVLVADALLRALAIAFLVSALAAVLSYAIDLVAIGGLIALTIRQAKRGEARLAAAGR
ncbi:MAG TPA: VC0807 family protein [Candidatus Baltobacteraceae bacterium]|nr:VC0807 family protein [Candidatus Baltobacteraceae bacterium]